MAKVRVYELARELGLEAAEAVARLKTAGFAVKGHTSSVERAAALVALEAEAPAAPRASRGKRKEAPAGKRKRRRIDAPPGTVVIKKYGNRRLYSTDQSRYLTLEELETLIREGQNVLVVDAASGEDLTSQVLTQILLEGGRARRFPVAFLEQIIRLGDDALQTFIGRYLMTGLDMFLAAQREVGRAYQTGLSAFGMWPWGGYNGPGSGPQRGDYGPRESAAPPPAAGGGDDEMERLRQRLEQLERHVAGQHAAPQDEYDD